MLHVQTHLAHSSVHVMLATLVTVWFVMVSNYLHTFVINCDTWKIYDGMLHGMLDTLVTVLHAMVSEYDKFHDAHNFVV